MLLWQQTPTILVVNKSSSKSDDLVRMHMAVISMVEGVCEVAVLDRMIALAAKGVVDSVRMVVVGEVTVPVVEVVL